MTSCDPVTEFEHIFPLYYRHCEHKTLMSTLSPSHRARRWSITIAPEVIGTDCPFLVCRLFDIRH